MAQLNKLPDDILILIFSSCHIDTLFASQLTCNRFSHVIRSYIKTIAPNSARITYPSCDILLEPPEEGYSLLWLRSRIPAQLASIVLDKDKLRRYVYIHSGFPYGIPSESDCDEAKRWRAKIADGWRIIRALYLISKEVYNKPDDELKRPNALRRASSGVRSSRIWQTMSCPYAGCAEHGVKHIFGSKHRRSSASSTDEGMEGDTITVIRRRESIILEKRLAFIERLSDQDLLSYTYLWRLLSRIFRPYRRPEETVWNAIQGWNSKSEIPLPSWSSIISDIAQGCSWLIWYTLHIGPSPFIQQWSVNSAYHTPASPNLLRNMIWKAWSSRTPHQIEVEREYTSKFEFALRKRCLSSERLKRLESEINRGRNIRTITLDCIPWVYDLHPSVMRLQSDFPWYKDGQWIWMDGEWYLQTCPGTMWSQPGMLKSSLINLRERRRPSGGTSLASDEDGVVKLDEDKGPLKNVPYLVYLGVEDASHVWASSDGDAPELVF